MASIRKRGNNYQITVSLGRNTEDQKVRESVTFTPTATTEKGREKEVAEFAADFEKRVKEGKYLSGEKLSYKDVCERWRTDWALDHLSDHGEAYYEMIETFAYPVFGNLKISKIRPLHIQDWISDMKRKGFASTTIRRRVGAANSVFRYAYRLQIIQENPVDRAELPRIKKDDELHYFTVEQAKRFLRALSEPYTEVVKGHTRTDDTGKKYKVPDYTMKRTLPLQHQVYFHLAVYGGFRRGELGALTWSDIDYEARTVSINKAVARRKDGQVVKSPKTVSGYRTVTLPPVCFDLLRRWQKEQLALRIRLGSEWKGKDDMKETYIFINDFGGMHDISSVRKRFHDIIKRYNDSVENEEDKLPLIRLHDLRHTSATLLVAAGCDYATISHRLGHSKVSVTLDIYSHPLPENDIAASDILDRVLSV